MTVFIFYAPSTCASIIIDTFCTKITWKHLRVLLKGLLTNGMLMCFIYNYTKIDWKPFFVCTWMENWQTHFKTLNTKLCNCQSSSVIILRRNRLSFATQISVKDKGSIFHTHLLYTNIITLNIEITFNFWKIHLMNCILIWR